MRTNTICVVAIAAILTACGGGGPAAEGDGNAMSSGAGGADSTGATDIQGSSGDGTGNSSEGQSTDQGAELTQEERAAADAAEQERIAVLEQEEETQYVSALEACDPCVANSECPAEDTRNLPNLSWLECGGQDACSNCQVELAPGLSLRIPRHAITLQEDSRSIQVSGQLGLPTPAGELTLFGVNVMIGEENSRVYLHGTSFVPAPEFGFIAPVEIGDPATAAFGYGLGIDIPDLGVPLQPDRSYFYFNFQTGFEATAGPVSFSAPGGTDATMVLDPTDPFFYISGALFSGGDDAEGDGSDDDQPRAEDNEEGAAGLGNPGFGISLNGLIPYAPHTTWGLEDIDGIEEGFNGHLIQTGTLPIGHLPMELRGLLITDLDPDEDGDTPFDVKFYSSPDLRMGGNGDLFLAVPFLKFLSFEWPLGQASVSGGFGDLNEAYFSGVLQPDDPSLLFPEGLPIPIASAEVLVAGYVREGDLGNSFLAAEGSYGFDLSAMAAELGLELGAMSSTEAEMRMDAEGLRILGRSNSQLHSAISFDSEQEIELFIASDGLGSFVALRGAMLIAGQGLQSAEARVGGSGLFVNGAMVFASQQLELAGEITPAGPQLSGSLTINIPFSHVNIADLVGLLNDIERETGVLKTLEAQAARDADALAAAQGKVAAAKAPLDQAQTEVDRIDVLIAPIATRIRNIQADIRTAQRRTCSTSFGGCNSCGCGSCGFGAVACEIARGACLLAQPACDGVRAACGLANRVACETSRAAEVTSLGVLLAAAETERAVFVVPREVATVALNAARLPFDATVLVLRGAEAAAQATSNAYGATQRGLIDLENNLNSLPPVIGDFTGNITVSLGPDGLSGALSGELGGNSIGSGRVTFGPSPEACFELPSVLLVGGQDPEEFCAPI